MYPLYQENSHSIDSIIKLWHGVVLSFSGYLCGEYTGYRWIPITKGQQSFYDFFVVRLKKMNKDLSDRWFETPWHSVRKYLVTLSDG